jgi:hypothetical protein
MTQDYDIWHWQEPGKAWKGSGLYHITLKIPSYEPLLGDLVIPDNDPTKAYVRSTSFGAAVLDILRGVPSFYSEIQILHYCLMPDHIHSIWYVRHAMPRGISSAVRGFWQEVKKIGRLSSFTPNLIRAEYQERFQTLRDEIGAARYDALHPIFTEMPHIRPMGQRRQLPATLRYLDMNPQRLATKRLLPEYFRVQEGIEIAGRIYAGVGNADLLQKAKYIPVHVRRTMIEEAIHGDDKRLNDYMDSCIEAAHKGAVMVSPFIHEKEREVLYSVLADGGKVIYLADNGFGEYYKPSDGIFDAVANKQILILSPWPYDPKKRHITRAECVALNNMAEEICTLSSILPPTQ